jgi:hypothetical protein
VDAHFECNRNLTSAEDFNRASRLGKHTGCCQDGGGNFTPSLQSGELIEVYFIVSRSVRRRKSFTSNERQAPEDRQAAALAIQVAAFAGTRALALGTAARGLTGSGADSNTFALAILLGAFVWLKFMQFHEIPCLFYFFNLYQVIHLGKHTTQGGRIFVFDNLVQAVETQGAHGSFVRHRVTDSAFHERDAEHLGFLTHFSSAPRKAKAP